MLYTMCLSQGKLCSKESSWLLKCPPKHCCEQGPCSVDQSISLDRLSLRLPALGVQDEVYGLRVLAYVGCLRVRGYGLRSD